MIINDLDGYYIVFDTKNWNTELDTLIKYRKSDGFASGESYIFSRRIEIPKDEEQIKAIKLEYRKRIIIHRIHNLNLNDYPLEVLEKVYIELGGN